MFFIYNLLTIVASGVLKIVALFNPKLKLFVKGRQETFSLLQQDILTEDKYIWLHAASLGEFEQGLPILEKIKSTYPSYKILVTFFSPSGYEIKKNTAVANLVVYLPMDTKANVSKFLEIVNPKLVLFVKYEIWPNYLDTLLKQSIPTLLISAIFKNDQVYFKWYGGFMRKTLKKITHCFVQDEHSKQLLENINLNKVTISGDTRLDRVSEILNRDNSLEFMDSFKADKLCFVAGSTWPEDENILIEYINSTPNNLKFIFAPHTIKQPNILELARKFSKKTAIYSKTSSDNLKHCDVLIIDTIGLLTKIYSYADIAYVGGGFATGLHNTLEPAVFGIPVLIGPNYKGFKEAEDLVTLGGVLSISEIASFTTEMQMILNQPDFKSKTGALNSSYIYQNKGASIKIMDYIATIL